MLDLRIVKGTTGGSFDVHIGDHKTALQVECNPLSANDWCVFIGDEFLFSRASLADCRHALVLIADALEMEPT